MIRLRGESTGPVQIDAAIGRHCNGPVVNGEVKYERLHRVVPRGGVVAGHVGRAGRDGHGVEKLTCCQPLAVSLVKVAVANSVPLLDHRLPVCVPVLAALL